MQFVTSRAVAGRDWRRLYRKNSSGPGTQLLHHSQCFWGSSITVDCFLLPYKDSTHRADHSVLSGPEWKPLLRSDKVTGLQIDQVLQAVVLTSLPPLKLIVVRVQIGVQLL